MWQTSKHDWNVAQTLFPNCHVSMSGKLGDIFRKTRVCTNLKRACLHAYKQLENQCVIDAGKM